MFFRCFWIFRLEPALVRSHEALEPSCCHVVVRFQCKAGKSELEKPLHLKYGLASLASDRLTFQWRLSYLPSVRENERKRIWDSLGSSNRRSLSEFVMVCQSWSLKWNQPDLQRLAWICGSGQARVSWCGLNNLMTYQTYHFLLVTS